MIDRIPNSNNHGRINRIAANIFPVRTIGKELMKSMALKPTLINWQIGNSAGYNILEKTVSFDHPHVADIRNTICRMNNYTILNKSREIMKALLEQFKGCLGSEKDFPISGTHTTLVRFIEDGKDSHNLAQFYSGTLSGCGMLISSDENMKLGLDPLIRASFEKTLIFTIALDILSCSKRHDFTPLIKKQLTDFPLLDKVIKPANCFADLDAHDLVWSGRLLNYIKEVILIDLNCVIIEDIKTSDAYAVVKKDVAIINLSEISKLGQFDSYNIQNKIIIEK